MMRKFRSDMATIPHLSTAHKLKYLRSNLNENQTEFWSRFGVTQSQGSRFEQGMGMQSPLIILLTLYVESKISDSDLMVARSNSKFRMKIPHSEDCEAR